MERLLAAAVSVPGALVSAPSGGEHADGLVQRAAVLPFGGFPLHFGFDQVERWRQGAAVDARSRPCWVADDLDPSLIALSALLSYGRLDSAGHVAPRTSEAVEGFALSRVV
eukprot:11175968-Heterocapsa_arctica.AAC.1